MAALEGMNVKIGADMSELQQAGAKSTAILNDIAQSANKAQTSFSSIGVQASKASAAIGEVNRTSQGTRQLMQNLGDSIRDIPFGINSPAILTARLDHLSASFTQLVAETGSAKAALSSIGAGLTGAAGLGIAFVALTTAYALFSDQINDVVKGLFKSDEAVNRLADHHKGLVATLEEGAKSAGSEVFNLRVLEQAATDVSKPMDVRLKAVKDLQKEYPGYLGNLTAEAILNGKAAAQINLVVEALNKKAFADAASNKAGEIAGKQLDLRLRENFLLNEQVKVQKELAAAKANNVTDESGVNVFGKNAESHLAEINRLLVKNREEQKFNNQEMGFYTAEVAKSFDATEKLNKEDFKKPKDVKHIKDVSDVLKQLNNELLFNQKLADIGFISSSEQDVQKIAKVKSAIEELIKLPKGKAVAVDSPVINSLIGSIQPEEVRQQLAARSKEIVKTLKTVSQTDLYKASDAIQIKIPIDIKPSANLDRALEKIDEQLRDDFAKLAKNIQKNVINSGLTNLGELIGDAIGGGNVAGAFRGLLNTIIGGMKQLGEAMIGLGTAKIALEKFNLVPGVGTVLAGVGVIALSSLIQSALPKFADGVSGFGGGVALVGERGPELVRLPQGSDVIPNHRLSQVTGSGPQIFIPALTFKGSDMLIQFNRANQQFNRRG